MSPSIFPPFHTHPLCVSISLTPACLPFNHLCLGGGSMSGSITAHTPSFALTHPTLLLFPPDHPSCLPSASLLFSLQRWSRRPGRLCTSFPHLSCWIFLHSRGRRRVRGLQGGRHQQGFECSKVDCTVRSDSSHCSCRQAHQLFIILVFFCGRSCRAGCPCAWVGRGQGQGWKEGGQARFVLLHCCFWRGRCGCWCSCSCCPQQQEGRRGGWRAQEGRCKGEGGPCRWWR